MPVFGSQDHSSSHCEWGARAGAASGGGYMGSDCSLRLTYQGAQQTGGPRPGRAEWPMSQRNSLNFSISSPLKPVTSFCINYF